MKKIIVLSALCITISSLATAQNKTTNPTTEKYVTSASGIKYIIYPKAKKSSKTPTPKATLGNIVFCNVSYSTEKDSMIFSNASFGQTLQVPVEAPKFKGDLSEMLQLLSVGDSAKFFLSADSVFEKTFEAELPEFIRPGSDMIFRIKVEKISTPAALEAEAKVEAEVKKAAQKVNIDKCISDRKITVNTTASGLKYVITQQGNGDKPNAGNRVKVHYNGTLLNGKKFDSSYDRGEPLEFELGRGQVIKGWDEAIALLNEGTKATFFIPFELAYGAQGAGGDIQPYEPLVFDIELISAGNEAAAPLINEVEVLNKYAESNKLNVITTASGLKYIITQKGSNEMPMNGKKVKVHYRGTLTDGTKFDASYDRNQPFEFVLGQGQVIQGWDEGIALISKGSKGILLIPSALGYGNRGAGGIIKPNSPLIFEVEVLEIEK